MDEKLFSAIEAENYSLARDLCLKGARADQLHVHGGISCLHLLAGLESEEASDILELCFEAMSCNPNVKSFEGLTPLHVAAVWGRLPNIKILIKNGSHIEETDEEGNSALDLAQDAGCIKLLLELESSSENKLGNATKVNNTESEFSDSFYTALDRESILDNTVVTFPKLHPWHADLSSTCDFEDTVIDEFNHLSISSCRKLTSFIVLVRILPSQYILARVSLPQSFADSLITLDETTQKQEGFYERPSCHEHVNEDHDFANSTILYDWKECSTVVDQSFNDCVIVPDSLWKLSDDDLKKELIKYGEIPGPIMPSTRKVYVKRLARLQSGTTYSQETQFSEYLPELRVHLEGRAMTPDLFKEEESMCQDFNVKKNWREGTEKSSFNYLLIDPRVTQNLPSRAKRMTEEEVFRVFIMAIFYVGKGKRSRPYAHLNEALNPTKDNPKINQIRDIWAAGDGVVSLHIFQSVIPVEAYTREACMIDALGLPRLTNKKRGDFYGRAQTWPQKKRREMGVFLLKRALKILLSEGERQLRPEDLKMTHSS